jgi:hypothetical protein
MYIFENDVSIFLFMLSIDRKKIPSKRNIPISQYIKTHIEFVMTLLETSKAEGFLAQQHSLFFFAIVDINRYSTATLLTPAND